MKIKTVATILTTNSAGQVVESLPVREVAGPVQNGAGQWVAPVAVQESTDGIPVRVVTDAVVLNSVGRSVASLPVFGTYDPDAAALFARMSVQPDATRKALIDKTIRDLKTAGIWSGLGFIHFPAAHDAQAARLCWNNSAYDLTAIGSPAFTVDRGYKGDGVGAYLNCNVAPTTLPQWAQDAATAATWETENNNTGGTDNVALGLVSATTVRLWGRSNADQVGARINTSSGAAAASTEARGLVSSTRIGPGGASQDQLLYKNGVQVATTGNASGAVSSSNFAYLRSVGVFSTKQVGFGYAAGIITPQQHADLYTIVSHYMTQIGAA